MCVTEDSHHNIWVGTRHGLFRYNASDNSFTRFSVADGLPNDFVYGILEDELARLWISTNNGMACFDTQKNTFRRYTLRDGIANNQFNLYSYCRSRDGIFWFGGIGGITWFRPHDLVDNPFAPEPQITGVDVADADGDRRVRIERDSAGRVTAAAFPSVRNIFTVRFVAVNPLAGGRNTFAYKLEDSTPAGTRPRTSRPTTRTSSPGTISSRSARRTTTDAGTTSPRRSKSACCRCGGRPSRRRFCGCCWRWDSSGASWRRCWAA